MKKSFLLIASLFFLASCVPVDEAAQGSLLSQLPPPTGPKKLIAVANFENKTDIEGQLSLGSGMAEQLTDALIQSGYFIVLERQDIKGVLEEQNFGASGRATQTGGAKIGKLNRAQILIKGAITEYASQESGGGQGINIKGFNIGMESSSAHVGVIIYLYDTSTGQVLESQRCEGKAESGGLKWSYAESDFNFGQSGFKQTPMGKATQMSIDQAVYFIVKKMSLLPWEGRIVKAKTDKVYINAGESGGIQVGDEFEVYREGESLIDPDSGLNLGSEQTLIGRVQVAQVKEKFSIAIPISGSGFEKNNVIKFVPRPIPIESTTQAAGTVNP